MLLSILWLRPRLAQSLLQCLPRATVAELLWRVGRICAAQLSSCSDKAASERMARCGLQLAAEALEMREDSAPAHKWYAILLSATSAFASMKEKISAWHGMTLCRCYVACSA